MESAGDTESQGIASTLYSDLEIILAELLGGSNLLRIVSLNCY